MPALDLYLLHVVNGVWGSWTLDGLAHLEEGSELFRGGLMVLPFCWFWFAGEGKVRDDRRRVIVAALLGTFATLILARALASALPFRLRPMFETGIDYRAPSIAFPMNVENWSAFPSDTAAVFFALSVGIIHLSRRLGIAALVYSAVWICLPRIYLGIHYPTDIVAGALLGSAVSWATVAAARRGGVLDRFLLTPLFTLERRHPGFYYAASFAVLFEISAMFDDGRTVGRAAIYWLHHHGARGPAAGVLLLLAGIVVAAVALAVAWAVSIQRRRHPADTAASNVDAGALAPARRRFLASAALPAYMKRLPDSKPGVVAHGARHR